MNKNNFDIIKFIRGVQINGKELNDTAYYVEHWDRYLKTINYANKFIKKKDLKILEIGFSPIFMPLFISITKKEPSELKWVSTSVGPIFGKLDHHFEDLKIKWKPNSNMNLKHYPNVNMERKPIPLQDDMFDVIFFLDVIEHFLFDPAFALSEIGRVMKKGGILIISTDNAFRLAKIIQMLIYGNYPAYQYRKDPYSRHNHEYTKKQLEALVTSLGYTILDCKYINLSMHKFKKNSNHYIYEAINTVTALLTRFSRHIFLCAEKNKQIELNYIDMLYKEIDEYRK